MDAQTPGGIVHTYQRYDPVHFPSPTAPPPDMVSPMMEHMLAFGDTDEFTEEQLANAIRLDASQIAGLGPSINALKQILLERRQALEALAARLIEIECMDSTELCRLIEANLNGPRVVPGSDAVPSRSTGSLTTLKNDDDRPNADLAG